jgi:cyclophilin family peptidyl-prolyl cis-trans isomerase
MHKRLVLLSIVAAFFAGCQSNPAPSGMDMIEDVEAREPAQSAGTNTVEEPMQAGPSIAAEEPQEQERNTVMILVKTSKGDIKIELDPEKAPKTVENFLGYAEAGHYNGTIFHRVMNGFMIQGGGFDANMEQKPAPRMVENEASNGLKNVVGSIAMARTPDPHSASAQFFINLSDNAFLDYPGQDGWGYCVFGQVVEGMDVVDAIKAVPTGNSGSHQNVPTEPILINEVSVIEE